MLAEEIMKKKLEKAFESAQVEALFEVIQYSYRNLVKVSDFNELKEVVLRLAEAQERTEHRMDRLAEAQERTEQRMDSLALAQEKTEKAILQLSSDQSRTEQALLILTREHSRTREMLGGLSDTVGYRLEDEAYKALPALLERDYGLVLEGRLKRGFVPVEKGPDVEVNILGTGTLKGRKVTIIGESKSRLSKNGVDEFLKKKLKILKSRYRSQFPVLVTYMITSSDVEEYAKEKGIALYYSYDF